MDLFNCGLRGERSLPGPLVPRPGMKHHSSAHSVLALSALGFGQRPLQEDCCLLFLQLSAE